MDERLLCNHCNSENASQAMLLGEIAHSHDGKPILTTSHSWGDLLRVEADGVEVEMRRVEPDAAKHTAQARARGAAHTPTPVDVESLVCGNQPCGDSAAKQADEREEGGDVWRERARRQRNMQGVLSAAPQASGLLPSQAPTLKDPRPHPPPTSSLSAACLGNRPYALRATSWRPGSGLATAIAV